MVLSTTTVTRGTGRTAPARPTRPALAVAALTFLALLGTAACAAPEPVTPDPVTVTPTIAPSRVLPPEPQIPVVWPLTGVATEEVAQRPAIAVKIENTSAARPQAGLEDADVVWETIVEFEVSRLVAVYHSKLPEEIGPVRSVRPMDIPIASPLRGPFVFSGGQQGILNLVYKSTLQALSHDAGVDGLYRVSRRYAPHNVYASLSTLLEQADGDHSDPPEEQFAFAQSFTLATAVQEGTPAETLSFELSGASHPNWTWDPESGTWLRSEGSDPAMAEAGDRLAAVNVVSIVADHPPSGFGAQNNASVPTYDLVGEGDCVVATGGKTVAGRWEKTAEDAPMKLFLADGTPLLLAPGNTWVELVPAGDGSLTID